MAEPIWTPSRERVEKSRMWEWMRARGFERYSELHRWSVDEPEAFWGEWWQRSGVIADSSIGPALVDRERMPGARWFPEARLNFAENLLRRRDDGVALVFRGETGSRRELSYRELAAQVFRAARALQQQGVRRGDRVAGLLPNVPEAVICMLATTQIGAIWSSCSPDFGVQGVLDRFGQIDPKLLIACDGYSYGGRYFDVRDRVKAVLEGLSPGTGCVLVPHAEDEAGQAQARSGLPDTLLFDEWLAPHSGSELDFERFPFDHPIYILYSSGTTGKPKCIVHGAGGTLLQHTKEHQLHLDLRESERLHYFTTCGWMMWNWMVSGLATGATLVLTDGSPFHPDAGALFRLAEQERLDVLGVSAKFLDAVAKGGYRPAEEHDLSSLRTLLSTGSPLLPEGFDFVYEHVASDLQLASMSGGTDILSCFVLGEPTSPVFRGEIQAPGLGMRVRVFDSEGRRIIDEPGELVCRSPFPSMPLGFWRDPEQARYRAAYFERFPGVWCHADWSLETGNGGFVIHGRSDAVLNPGGVRIGTAEIYRPVERLAAVQEAIAVGQSWEGDVRVVLFVKLMGDRALDDALREEIRAAVRAEASPRHVPARILQVSDIPRTRSGKITEIAVRDVLHGRPVANLEALENPEALEHFRGRTEVAS